MPATDSQKISLVPGTVRRITGEGDLGDVLRGAGTMLFIRLIATGIAYVSILALARWMGAAEYGAFAYAFAWINFLALPAGLGIPAASVRFLSEYSAAGSTSYIRGLLLRGVSLTVVTSIAIAIAAIAIVLFDSNRIPSAYRAPLTIGIAGLPVIALFILGSQVGRAFGWVAAAYSPMQIWHPLVLLAFAGIVVASRTPLVAQTMVLASLAIAAICCVVQGTIYVRRLKPRLRNIPPLYDQRRWLRVSFPLLRCSGQRGTQRSFHSAIRPERRCVRNDYRNCCIQHRAGNHRTPENRHSHFYSPLPLASLTGAGLLCVRASFAPP